MKQLVATLGSVTQRNWPHGLAGWIMFAARPFVRLWRLAEAHELNPWVFIAMSVAGYLVQAMVLDRKSVV